MRFPKGSKNIITPTADRRKGRLLGILQQALPVSTCCFEFCLVLSGVVDWVTSLFRRVLALYENLPEEGGSKGTTGGKQEEAVLKCIKSMMDIVCLHLSDELFDLVLRLVYDYATANAKSNAVRALGQLIACLARVKPEQTITKFLPFCILQIKEELKHGASSTRTTSTHVAIPSDTTLHWSKRRISLYAFITDLACVQRYCNTSWMPWFWWQCSESWIPWAHHHSIVITTH